MKKLTKLICISLCSVIFILATSCATITPVTHDQGNHNGWYKNPNNPHHPGSVKTEKKNGKSKSDKMNQPVV